MKTLGNYNIIYHYEPRQFHKSEDTQLFQVIGPLMEPKFKLLAYQNVVSDPIFMSECDNRSHIYIKI